MNERRTFLKQTALAGASTWLTSSGFASQVHTGIVKTVPKAMIVGTTGPVAIRAGLASMKRGGSAADAVLTTALAQIALCAGCWVSYAGRMTAMYYHAKTGRLHALNACYDAPRAEKNPLTIPRQPTPTGRNVLVPGMMAGVEALHKRFGKRPFKEIFDPTIKLAEQGFPLTRNLASLIRNKQKVLTRYQEGRNVFHDREGKLIRAGEHFVQPHLARTMKSVANHGAQFMYEGDWGQELVNVVQREGGKLSMEDLKQYRANWTEPLSADLGNGMAIHGLPSPNRGGPISIACLNLAAQAKLAEHGHYTKSVESLRRILKIETLGRIINWDRYRSVLSTWLGKANLERDDFADADLAAMLWKKSQTSHWEQLLAKLRAPEPEKSEHSDAVVALDPDGNVSAIIHTINTAGWGTTGLFVDGVSIPDSGASQQSAIAKAGPGGRISDHGPPLIATQNGTPILAGSATGSGNVNASWQNFIDVLYFGMNAQQAADSPNFYNRTFEVDALAQPFLENAQNAGIELRTKPRFGGFERGFWAGIHLDATTKAPNAGKIRLLDGITAQY